MTRIVNVNRKTNLIFVSLFFGVSMFTGCKTPIWSNHKAITYYIHGEAGHLTSIDGDKRFLTINEMSKASSNTKLIQPNHNYSLRITSISGKETTFKCEVREEFVGNIVRQLPGGSVDHYGSEDIWHWRAIVQTSEPISKIQLFSKNQIIAQCNFEPPILLWPQAKDGLTNRSTRTLPLQATSTTATRRFGSAG